MFKRIIFFALFATACHQNYEEGANPPPIPPAQAQMPANHPPVSAPRATGESGVVSGIIRIDDKLVGKVPKSGVLYIFARPAPTAGPPLVVKRLEIPQFPYTYTLTQADAGMMPGQDVDLNSLDALYIVAKIDQDGKVGPAQPGDMEGSCQNNPIQPGDQNADILINMIH